MSDLSYHHLLTLAGFIKKKCSACSGNAKASYERGSESLEIYKLSRIFRYSKDRLRISGGSIEHLQHQHFMKTEKK